MLDHAAARRNLLLPVRAWAILSSSFFFQAEAGIRDYKVTGVQTCALPIYDVPDGKTVLQAGLDAGYELPYSCREGVCRTCRGTIKEGTVDYGHVSSRYLPGEDKAKGYALLCQAKPLADLVVEVRELAGLHGIRPKILPARIERLDRPAPDVAILGVKLPANANFKFVAGQYVDFLLKDAKRRSYSIANPPTEAGVAAPPLHTRPTPRRPVTHPGVM